MFRNIASYFSVAGAGYMQEQSNQLREKQRRFWGGWGLLTSAHDMVIEHVRLNSCIWYQVCLASFETALILYPSLSESSFMDPRAGERFNRGRFSSRQSISAFSNLRETVKMFLNTSSERLGTLASSSSYSSFGFRVKRRNLKEDNKPLMLKSLCGT